MEGCCIDAWLAAVDRLAGAEPDWGLQPCVRDLVDWSSKDWRATTASTRRRSQQRVREAGERLCFASRDRVQRGLRGQQTKA